MRYRAIRKGFPDWADFARTPATTGPDVGAMRTRLYIGPTPEKGPTAADHQRSVRGPGSAPASAAGVWRRLRRRVTVRRRGRRAS